MGRGNNLLLLVIFAMSVLDRLSVGGPMSDVMLTDANALDGEEDPDDFFTEDDFKPNKDKIAQDVAGALVKGLEDSIEGNVLF